VQAARGAEFGFRGRPVTAAAHSRKATNTSRRVSVTFENSRKQSFRAKVPLSLFGADCDVPLFVEHCEAVAAEIDVKLRWLG
jgi:hypothetical protein